MAKKVQYTTNQPSSSTDYLAADNTWKTMSGGGGSSIPKGTASGTDTYTTTISGVSAYNDGDAYLIRFTNGNTTGCTLNINSLGAIDLYRNNDGALIGGDIIDGAEMLCVYNSSTNRFQVIGTAPNTLLSYVTNAESITITKGQPVYAFGGTGDRLKVKLAYNSTDATSAQTIGLVLSSSIAANQKGLIIMQGQLDGLSILPTSTWADGDPIYLGSTAGTITKTKPSAPNHLVYLGFVTTANNGSAGRMYVRVQNGYELDEIHDVKITSVANNDILKYNSSNGLWENSNILSTKQDTITGAATTITSSNLTANRAVISNASGKIATNSVTDTELGYLSGVTSAIQTQFTNKQDTIIGGATTITSSNLTASRALVSDGGGKVAVSAVTTTELGRLVGVTSDIQTQLNAKQGTITLTTTGTSGAATLVGSTLNIPQYSPAGQSVNIFNNVLAQALTGAASPTTRYHSVAGTISSLTTAYQIPLPTSATFGNFYFRIYSAQPASGSLVLTLQKNAVDTAVTITIAAGSAIGNYTDNTNTSSFAAGDTWQIKIVQNATSGSTNLGGYSFKVTGI